MSHIRFPYKFLIIILIIIQVILTGLLYKSLSDEQPLFPKKYRILACISSFKRPIFVSGQVLRMANQTYPVDISLSVKGVPADFVKTVLQPEWQPLMNSGRLMLRIDPNRDQFSNLLDTVRNIDISKYDYFCKIDDDDWYSPDYFKHVNEWLNKQKNIAISSTTRAMTVREGKGNVITNINRSNLSGPTMCFSREVILAALEIERNPEATKKYLSFTNLTHYRRIREDNFLHQLGRAIGKAQERKTPFNDVVYGQQYPSVIRGGGYL